MNISPPAPMFFIDTADINYIDTLLAKMPKEVLQSCAGVTTNPSALHKMDINTKQKLKDHLCSLANVLDKKLTNLTNHTYEIHVQLPNSNATIQELFTWDTFLTDIEVNLPAGANLVMKVPPRLDLLTYVDKDPTALTLNVTGLTSADVCLKCMEYSSVDYVSIIPGRMLEAGIDPTPHLERLRLATRDRAAPAKVITGSMRTIEGLRTCIEYGTVPTIGSRVWDLFTPIDFESFIKWWNVQPPQLATKSLIYSKNELVLSSWPAEAKLSLEFFETMDRLGTDLYGELRETP